MISKKQALVDFMNLKNELFLEFATEKYMTKEDEEQINTLDEKEASDIFNELYLNIAEYCCYKNSPPPPYDYINDRILCVFCNIKSTMRDDDFQVCDNCSYGIRHLKCNDYNSSYNILMKQINECLEKNFHKQIRSFSEFFVLYKKEFFVNALKILSNVVCTKE